jgi:DNA (cytosine-5)-methyltransferase 1
MLTVGSLFAGIGGFDLGAERAGFEVRWQVEIDPFCQRVLAKHWPNAERFEDVRRVRTFPPADVICGGFPCQDISNAGDRAGISGERSGLWRQLARAIRMVRPKYALVENVAALLGRGMGRVCGDLAARRYDAEWDCIPAAAVGAHHQRDRIWILAYPTRHRVEGERVSGEGRQRVADADRSGEDVADHPQQRQRARRKGRSNPGGARQSEQSLPPVADASQQERIRGPLWAGWRERSARSLAETYERHRSENDGIWFAEPAVGRVAHGVPPKMVEDELRVLGNSIVPQIAEWIFRRIAEAEAFSEAMLDREEAD